MQFFCYFKCKQILSQQKKFKFANLWAVDFKVMSTFARSLSTCIWQSLLLKHILWCKKEGTVISIHALQCKSCFKLMKIHILNFYQVCVKSSILLTLILFSKGNNYFNHMNNILCFYKDHEDVVKNDKNWHFIS